MNTFDFQTRMETEEFLATGKDPQPATEHVTAQAEKESR